MNIEPRKLNLVQWLIKLKNETYLNKVEQLYKEYRKANYESLNQPMSLEELYEIIEKAEQDITLNRVITHEDVLSHFANKL